MTHTPLIIHTKKGTAFKPGDLVGMGHAARADYVTLPNGDAVGRVLATSAQARQVLGEHDGITVLPPLHRPITAEHEAAFAHVNAKAGETGYDIAERLRDYHKMPWFDPEESFL